MSCTTVYAMPISGPLVEVAEFNNAWGSAMRIWESLSQRYFGCPMFSADEKKVWALTEDSRLTKAEKAVHLWTFDKAVVEAERLSEMADCFDEFERLHPTKSTSHLQALVTFHPSESVSHLPALAALYRKYKPVGILGLCVVQTSVSGDVWNRPDEEDTDESRLYDASKDEGHFFVMRSLEVEDEK